MGVDYNGVGGIGIRVTDDVAARLIAAGMFTQDEWDDRSYECIEKLRTVFSRYGSAYSGDETYMLLVEGETFGEIKANVSAFVDKMRGFGLTDVTEDSLEVISECHIW